MPRQASPRRPYRNTIALRNGVVAITEQPNQGPKLNLTKDDWSKLITGEKNFASQHASLKAFDTAIGR